MHERVVTDAAGCEVLVRSHTGTVASVTREQGRLWVVVTIDVDPPDDRPGRLVIPLKVELPPDDPMVQRAQDCLRRPVRWVAEWRRDPSVPADLPIREVYRRDRARAVLVELEPVDTLRWDVPDTIPADWT